MAQTAHYLRYSSEDQIRGISLQTQLARLKSESAVAGEVVVATYIDQARSGTKAANRPEYQAMLAAARRHEFTRIRIESVDRGHRNDGERRAFEDEMSTLGIEVVYCGESLKQAPDQRKFQRGLRGLLAELESDTLSQRVYDRQVTRAQKGKWRGGPRPYGVQSDGQGWFIPEEETYPYLLWILERRAEGTSYHGIAKQLNQGISLNGEPAQRPHTPGTLAYLRKPYLERQDPETGDVLQLPRTQPSGSWTSVTVFRICQEAVDGVYAGVYVWGKRPRRFTEDRYGNPKQVVRAAVHPPLVPEALLYRVQAIESGIKLGKTSTMTSYHGYILELYCGDCGHKMHGYSASSYKPNGKVYKYHQYRCGGRSTRPGTCTMTSISSHKLEDATLNALVAYLAQIAPDTMTDAILSSVERYRNELLGALAVLDHQRPALIEERNGLLRNIVQAKSGVVREAFEQRIEEISSEIANLDQQVDTMRLGLSTLDERARAVSTILAHPDLCGARSEERTRLAFKRVLRLLVHRLELRRIDRERFCVAMTLYHLGSLLDGSCQTVTGGSEYHLFLTNPAPTGYNPRSQRLLPAIT
jgi:DNA invertase Pin-like site-specific DNA recombinase